MITCPDCKGSGCDMGRKNCPVYPRIKPPYNYDHTWGGCTTDHLVCNRCKTCKGSGKVEMPEIVVECEECGGEGTVANCVRCGADIEFCHCRYCEPDNLDPCPNCLDGYRPLVDDEIVDLYIEMFLPKEGKSFGYVDSAIPGFAEQIARMMSEVSLNITLNGRPVKLRGGKG